MTAPTAGAPSRWWDDTLPPVEDDGPAEPAVPDQTGPVTATGPSDAQPVPRRSWWDDSLPEDLAGRTEPEPSHDLAGRDVAAGSPPDAVPDGSTDDDTGAAATAAVVRRSDLHGRSRRGFSVRRPGRAGLRAADTPTGAPADAGTADAAADPSTPRARTRRAAHGSHGAPGTRRRLALLAALVLAVLLAVVFWLARPDASSAAGPADHGSVAAVVAAAGGAAPPVTSR